MIPDAQEYPKTAASDVLVVNKNKKIPVRSVEIANVIFLPPTVHFPAPLVQSTTMHAMRDPGIPRTDMMV